MLKFKYFLILLCSFCGVLIQAQEPEKVIEVSEEKGAYELSNSEYFLIEAAKYVFLEDFDKAIAHLDKAIEIDENNHAAYFKKAEILSGKEEYREALAQIEKAIALEKTNRYYYVLGAQIQKSLGQLNEAAKMYELMYTNTSGWEVYGEEMIDAFIATDQASFALEVLPELLAYYPNHPSLLLKKAEIEIKSGNENAALATLAQAFDKFPEDPTVLKAYVQTLSNAGKNEILESTLRQVMDDNYRAKILLAEFLLSQQRFEEIEKLSLELFQDDQATIETRLLAIGYLFKAEKTNISRIDSLQTVLSSRFPQQALVFENGGYVYEQLANKSKGDQRMRFQVKAIDSHKKAAQLDPNNFEAWLKVFEYEIEKELWNDLLDDIEYLLDLYPNQAILFYYYAEAYRGLDDLQEAISLVDQGLRIGGRNELIKSLLLAEKAKIYTEQQKDQEADALFNQALNTENVDERAIYAYARWLNEVNPKATIELIKVFEKALSPSEKWVEVELKAYMAQNDFKQAKKRLESFFKEQPSYASGRLFELYGDILFELGEADEALLQWRKALTLGDFSEKLEKKIETRSIN